SFSGGGVGTPGAVDARCVVLNGAPRDFAGATSVDLTATGLIQADAANFTGPEGWVGTPYRGLTMFGLIGLWSSDPTSIQPIGSPFDIGSSKAIPVPASAHAYLFVAENDGAFSDNTGSFSVVITVR